MGIVEQQSVSRRASPESVGHGDGHAPVDGSQLVGVSEYMDDVRWGAAGKADRIVGEDPVA